MSPNRVREIILGLVKALRDMMMKLSRMMMMMTSLRPLATVAAPRQQRRKKNHETLKKLRSLTVDFLDKTYNNNDNDNNLTEANLTHWAKLLAKEGGDSQSFEIYEFMDKKKMEFTSSSLVHYAELTNKFKGIVVCGRLFEKFVPNHSTNLGLIGAKNWPAFCKLKDLEEEYRQEEIWFNASDLEKESMKKIGLMHPVWRKSP